MKVELTQRDKKLLTFLGVFVIVVLVGYYGILPQIKAANGYKDEIEEQELIRDVYQQKIMQLIDVEANNSELESLIEGAKDNYYPMMDSDAIDHLITNKVIDEYKLMSYDLNIGEKQLAELGPYIYSNKSITGESYALRKALSAAAPVVGEDGMTLMGDVAKADSETVGIYMVDVTMRLGGEKKNITRLLDDLAYSSKKIRLVSYTISTEETNVYHDDGTIETFSEDMLDLSIELYMCEE